MVLDRNMPWPPKVWGIEQTPSKLNIYLILLIFIFVKFNIIYKITKEMLQEFFHFKFLD